jgi:hypothetical protein
MAEHPVGQLYEVDAVLASGVSVKFQTAVWPQTIYVRGLKRL